MIEDGASPGLMIPASYGGVKFFLSSELAKTTIGGDEIVFGDFNEFYGKVKTPESVSLEKEIYCFLREKFIGRKITDISVDEIQSAIVDHFKEQP
jgi:hypothetical protein